MKFGGSSVGDAERITEVCKIVKSRLEKKPVVVVSAVKGVTDKLIDTAKKAASDNDVSKELEEIKERHHKILRDLGLDEKLVDDQLGEFFKVIDKIFILRKLNAELLDEVQSFGEKCSSKIVAAALTKKGIPSRACYAYDIGMITTPDYGNAEPLPDTEDKIKKALSKIKEVPVITGFIGKDSAGNITTLGRGGSDYTAGIIGAALDCTTEIWTDVNGMMTSDPRIVKSAKTIEKISFNEASELAYFGARVLHPKTIWPAVRKNLPVKILNSFEPDNKGTTIVKEAEKTKDVIKAIACKKNITVVNIVSTRMLLAHGFLSRIFAVFEDYKKSVDMIATTEVSVSLTVDNDKDLDKIKSDLEGVADIDVVKNKSIVSVVGEGMRHVPGSLGRVFGVIAKNKVNVEMVSGGASEINISFILDEKDADKAVQLLHKEYFGN